MRIDARSGRVQHRFALPLTATLLQFAGGDLPGRCRHADYAGTSALLGGVQRAAAERDPPAGNGSFTRRGAAGRCRRTCATRCWAGSSAHADGRSKTTSLGFGQRDAGSDLMRARIDEREAVPAHRQPVDWRRRVIAA